MPPAPWLTDHAHLLPRTGMALDLACGSGRHALWLAERGLSVTALDRDADAVRRVQDEAARRGLRVTAAVCDLESRTVSLGEAVFDVIVGVHYLHRPLFPALLRALRPGGLLIYETFTRAQAQRGRPTNPDFLLDAGELIKRVAPLELLSSREGTFDDREVASIVARKPEGPIGAVPAN